LPKNSVYNIGYIPMHYKRKFKNEFLKWRFDARERNRIQRGRG
jgi:hypothetical protein